MIDIYIPEVIMGDDINAAYDLHYGLLALIDEEVPDRFKDVHFIFAHRLFAADQSQHRETISNDPANCLII